MSLSCEGRLPLQFEQSAKHGSLRLLHVLPTMSPGGAQNVAIELAKHARASGIDAATLCLGAPPTKADHVDYDSKAVHYLDRPFPSNFRNLYQFSLAQRSLSRFLHEMRPQIIHSHLFLSKLPLAFNATAHESIIVDTVHDNLPWWRQRSVKSHLMRRFDRYYASSIASHSVAISESVRNDLIRFRICNDDRCSTIYNFIDERWSQGAGKEDTRERDLILICCRISVQKKGLDLAVEIARQLVVRHPGLKFVVLGDGEDMPVFRAMIANAGMGKFFQLIGHVHDPLPFYRKASLLLMPSRWEGFGLTAAEAGAAGCPVVASRVGGLAEVIRDGETGLLCDAGASNQFTRAIRRLLSDDALRKQLGESASNTVRDRFRPATAVLAYHRLYARLIRHLAADAGSPTRGRCQ